MDTDKIEQLDAYLVQELHQDESDLFGREIQADANLSEEFVQQARMDAALAALLADEKTAQNFAQGVLASVQTTPERSLTKSVLSEILDEREASTRSRQPRPFDWWVWTKTAAIAAVAAVATVWVLQSVQLDTGNGQVAPQAKFLARLTADESAQWGEESLRARDDGWLQSGAIGFAQWSSRGDFWLGCQGVIGGACGIRCRKNEPRVSQKRAFDG